MAIDYCTACERQWDRDWHTSCPSCEAAAGEIIDIQATIYPSIYADSVCVAEIELDCILRFDGDRLSEVRVPSIVTTKIARITRDMLSATERAIWVAASDDWTTGRFDSAIAEQLRIERCT